MRCLHCDQQLPFYLRVAGRSFCNRTHQNAYRTQESLVLERLRQAEHLIRKAMSLAVDPMSEAEQSF